MPSARPVPPPVDPELKPLLEAQHRRFPRVSADSLAQRRRLSAELTQGAGAPDLTAGGRIRVEDHVAPGPPGAPDLTLLVLRRPDGGSHRPAVYHIHGGGMVVGHRRGGLDAYLSYVLELDAVVVSVEYRLAPEHPDPAPIEDCYAGLLWTAGEAESLGIDPSRILVAGESAGGGLAAGTALMARDRNGPALTHQVLVGPMLDDRLETPSSLMLDGDGSWDRHESLFGWTALLGDRRGGPDVSAYAAPARATDLSRLPRTYLDCGSAEGFRDEVLMFAGRLSEAGVPVDLHMWGGGSHAFDVVGADTTIGRAARATRDEFIRRALCPVEEPQGRSAPLRAPEG
jgi:acetyl esterase/lipase